MKLFIIILLTSMLLSSCGYVSGTTIPFTKIVDFNEWENEFNGQYNQSASMCLIGSHKDDATELVQTLNPAIRHLVESNDWNQDVVIACFLGFRGSAGEDISIRTIIFHEPEVYIYAHFTKRQEGKLYEMTIRSPVSVVSIERKFCQRMFR